MTRNEIENEIEEIRSELRVIAVLDEASVCALYNADSKDEAINVREDEIRFYKNRLDEMDAYRNRTINYEKTADMPFICW